MLQFFAWPLHFRLEVVDTSVISSRNVCQQAVVFCFVSLKNVAAMLDVKSWFSSPHHTQGAIVFTEHTHGGCLDNSLLNWREEMWTHASSVACHYKSVGMAYSSGNCDMGHSILNIIHMPDVEMSTYYHTVISYGDGLLSLRLYQIWVPGVFPGDKGGRCIRLTTYHHPVPLSRNLGTLTS